MPATAVSPRTRFLLRPVRAVLRPLATHSASSPIETIVLLSVVGTLAYFHILSAIKHSAFFAPAAPSALRPAHALLRDNEWVGVRENAWFDAVDNSATTVEMQQLIFSLDPAPGHKSNGVSNLFIIFSYYSNSYLAKVCPWVRNNGPASLATIHGQHHRLPHRFLPCRIWAHFLLHLPPPSLVNV